MIDALAAKPGVAIQSNPNVNYRSNLRPEVFALLPELRPGLRVLEIGCGDGAFCRQISHASEIWGIEPEPVAAGIARKTLHTVFTNIYDAVADQLPLAHFDLVICNDVIEHMTDHEWFLRDIKKHMAPGAMLLASIPNVRYHENLFNLIVLRDWHYQDYGILDRTHFRFFTFRSTRRSFEQAGYRLVRFEGINALPVTGWGVYKVAHRMFRVLLLLASLGRGGDVRFLQMGVLATPV